MIATFFAQVGLAIAIAYLLIAQPASPRPLWWIMGTVMMLEVLFSLFVAHVTMSAPRRQVDSWQSSSTKSQNAGELARKGTQPPYVSAP